MPTKNKVLQILENNRETDVSGERLAKTLDVSRAAVHKAVSELRRDGHIISASPNRGYRLSRRNDVVSAEGVRAFLDAEPWDIRVFKSLPSTNLTARQLAVDGAAHGTVVIADSQSAGRGRMGRGFYSPPGCGVYMSVILRPDFPARDGMLLTTLASVAVCRAVESYGLSPKIKWVNDILLDGKKVCGISTEAVTDLESGGIEFAVLGIGVNVSTGSFPAELENIAASLRLGGKAARNELAAKILRQLFAGLELIGSDGIITEYRKRSAVLGREIDVIRHDGTARAKAVDIDGRGGLVVELEDGTAETLISGEISIRGNFNGI
ncbi:MAG: biotin--[acetyl-CoA-carboxylase] ligase [Oscillospiraceae bacterium]|nr:biotin--[acetyl-CoA-carboxylase] ligase [Oscillospiraceae bacterium]